MNITFDKDARPAKEERKLNLFHGNTREYIVSSFLFKYIQAFYRNINFSRWKQLTHLGIAFHKTSKTNIFIMNQYPHPISKHSVTVVAPKNPTVWQILINIKWNMPIQLLRGSNKPVFKVTSIILLNLNKLIKPQRSAPILYITKNYVV